MLKRIALLVLAAVLLLAAVVAVNTLRQGSRQLAVPPAPPLAVDEKAVADKLAGAIRLRTVRSLLPDTIVAPGLYVAASASRLFVDIADHIYRFSPVRVAREDLPRLHGTNERIATANLAELVRFQLLRNLNAPPCLTS